MTNTSVSKEISKPTIATYKIKPTPEEYIKPLELIDIKETIPLKLSDKRIYNQLISNAWLNITEDKVHIISKDVLRGSMTGSERLTDTVDRLMKTVVLIKVIDKDGDLARQKFQLLAGTEEQKKADGVFRYKFPEELRAVIKNSNVWAKLQKEVSLAFNSKYSLELYELIQTKRNLSYKAKEKYSIEEIRDLLGVPEGKVQRFCDFNRDVLKRSVTEVNKLSDMDIAFVPFKKGRVVVGVEMWWKEKELVDVKKAHAALKTRQLNRKKPVKNEALPMYEAMTGFIDGEKLKKSTDEFENKTEQLLNSETNIF